MRRYFEGMSALFDGGSTAKISNKMDPSLKNLDMRESNLIDALF